MKVSVKRSSFLIFPALFGLLTLARPAAAQISDVTPPHMVSESFSPASVDVSLGPQSILVQGIGESRYGADTGASLSLSLTNTVRLYLNYDGKFRAAMQSHQGTAGVELKW